MRRKCAALDSNCASVGRPTVSVLRTFTNVGFELVADARAAGRRHERWNGISGRAENECFAGTPDQAVAYFSSLIAVGVRYFIVGPPTGKPPRTDDAPAVGGRSSTGGCCRWYYLLYSASTALYARIASHGSSVRAHLSACAPVAQPSGLSSASPGLPQQPVREARDARWKWVRVRHQRTERRPRERNSA